MSQRSPALQQLRIFNTISDIKDSFLVAGRYAHCAERRTNGDIIGSTFLIVDPNTYIGTPDDEVDFFVASGNIAQRIYGETTGSDGDENQNNDVIMLTSGQTVVTVVNSRSRFLLVGLGVDSKELILAVDYIIDSATQITLINSCPAGTKLVPSI